MPAGRTESVVPPSECYCRRNVALNSPLAARGIMISSTIRIGLHATQRTHLTPWQPEFFLLSEASTRLAVVLADEIGMERRPVLQLPIRRQKSLPRPRLRLLARGCLSSPRTAGTLLGTWQPCHWRAWTA